MYVFALDDGNIELKKIVYKIFKKRLEILLEGSYGISFF